VQRVEPNLQLTDALTNAQSASDRASIYAASGIWQDALATLAEQRCARPGDATLKTSWSRLLTSVQLENFAQESLTQSCVVMGSEKPGE
jgi:hypothetical protein